MKPDVRVKQVNVLIVNLGNHWQLHVYPERAGLGN